MKRLLIPILVLAPALTLPCSLQAADGAALYDKNCKKCHGDTGKGDTPMGKKFEIRDYTDASIQESMTDEEIAESIRNGLTNEDGRKVMLAFGNKLSDEEVSALVEHFRSLAGE